MASPRYTFSNLPPPVLGTGAEVGRQKLSAYQLAIQRYQAERSADAREAAIKAQMEAQKRQFEEARRQRKAERDKAKALADIQRVREQAVRKAMAGGKGAGAGAAGGGAAKTPTGMDKLPARPPIRQTGPGGPGHWGSFSDEPQPQPQPPSAPGVTSVPGFPPAMTAPGAIPGDEFSRGMDAPSSWSMTGLSPRAMQGPVGEPTPQPPLMPRAAPAPTEPFADVDMTPQPGPPGQERPLAHRAGAMARELPGIVGGGIQDAIQASVDATIEAGTDLYWLDWAVKKWGWDALRNFASGLTGRDPLTKEELAKELNDHLERLKRGRQPVRPPGGDWGGWGIPPGGPPPARQGMQEMGARGEPGAPGALGAHGLTPEETESFNALEQRRWQDAARMFTQPQPSPYSGALAQPTTSPEGAPPASEIPNRGGVGQVVWGRGEEPQMPTKPPGVADMMAGMEEFMGADPALIQFPPGFSTRKPVWETLPGMSETERAASGRAGGLVFEGAPRWTPGRQVGEIEGPPLPADGGAFPQPGSPEYEQAEGYMGRFAQRRADAQAARQAAQPAAAAQPATAAAAPSQIDAAHTELRRLQAKRLGFTAGGFKESNKSVMDALDLQIRDQKDLMVHINSREAANARAGKVKSATALGLWSGPFRRQMDTIFKAALRGRAAKTQGARMQAEMDALQVFTLMRDSIANADESLREDMYKRADEILASFMKRLGPAPRYSKQELSPEGAAYLQEQFAGITSPAEFEKKKGEILFNMLQAAKDPNTGRLDPVRLRDYMIARSYLSETLSERVAAVSPELTRILNAVTPPGGEGE